ncbi:MAG: SDR family oxidoreductase, partial [Dehalococcoidia bacterium]
ALAKEGAKVTLAARHEDALQQASARIAADASGAETLTIQADLSEPSDIQRVFDETQSKWGRVDILVNNLGGPPPGELQEFTDDQWQLAFDLNFRSAMRLNRLALPGMKEREFGRIISVLSKAIREPEDKLGLSTVARTALASYSKLLSLEVAGRGVTVNNVLPGNVETDRLRSVVSTQAKMANRTDGEQRAVRLAGVPAGRFGQPDEVGALIAFLASAHAGYLTGQNIAIDGGQIRAMW